VRSLSLCEVDIHVEVPRVEYEKLADDRLGEPSAGIRARVEKARGAQRQRFAGRMGGVEGKTPLLCNAEMPATTAQARVWRRVRCASTARSTMRARACSVRR
jgi:magnesium chelatase family protein